MDALCFDILTLVGKQVEIKRQEIRAGFWTHNGSNMRIVHNQLNNIILALEKHGKSITPKQSNPNTQYKYVADYPPTNIFGETALCGLKSGMHVARPIWGSWVRVTGRNARLTTFTWRFESAKDYIVVKTKECARNPRLTWAPPPLYGLYGEWADKYYGEGWCDITR